MPELLPSPIPPISSSELRLTPKMRPCKAEKHACSAHVAVSHHHLLLFDWSMVSPGRRGGRGRWWRPRGSYSRGPDPAGCIELTTRAVNLDVERDQKQQGQTGKYRDVVPEDSELLVVDNGSKSFQQTRSYTHHNPSFPYGASSCLVCIFNRDYS